MPVYDLRDRLTPDVGDQGKKDIKLIDSMVWEIKGEVLGVDPGLIFTNKKNEKLRILRVIYPAGAYSERLSEVGLKTKDGKPIVYRTVDCDGTRVDIGVLNLKTEKHQHYHPQDFEAWLDGAPKSITRYRVPKETGSAAYNMLMKRALEARKAWDAEQEAKAKKELSGGK
jgi:hypothetical protein